MGNLKQTFHMSLRVGAAIGGGYVFTWGFIATGTASLYASGMSFHDAQGVASLSGFLVFLGAFLWAFAARKLLRVWTVLGGGGALMIAAASWLQSMLVN